MRRAKAAAATAAPTARAPNGAQRERGAVSREALMGTVVKKVVSMSVENLQKVLCMIDTISDDCRPQRRRGRRGGVRHNRGKVTRGVELPGEPVRRYSRDELYALRPVHCDPVDRVPEHVLRDDGERAEPLPQAELGRPEQLVQTDLLSASYTCTSLPTCTSSRNSPTRAAPTTTADAVAPAVEPKLQATSSASSLTSVSTARRVRFDSAIPVTVRVQSPDSDDCGSTPFDDYYQVEYDHEGYPRPPGYQREGILSSAEIYEISRRVCAPIIEAEQRSGLYQNVDENTPRA